MRQTILLVMLVCVFVVATGVSRVSADGVLPVVTKTFDASQRNSIAIDANDRLYSWGGGEGDILGSAFVDCDTANLTWVMDDVASVSIGSEVGAVLTASGDLYAWGASSDFGYPGRAAFTDGKTPKYIGSGFSDISAGSVSLLALKSDGTLVYMLVATPETLGIGFVSVTTYDGGHYLALKANGDLYSWGDNCYGQLGTGTASCDWDDWVDVPTRIGSGYAGIAAGRYHSLAIKTDGSLWAWGYNGLGGVGDGTTVDKVVPTKIGDGYAAIAGGGNHSLGVKADGTLMAWGNNNSGQLALSSFTHDRVLTPTQIGTGYLAVAAGDGHSMIMKTDGQLATVGSNGDGQIGFDPVGGSTSNPYFLGTRINYTTWESWKLPGGTPVTSQSTNLAPIMGLLLQQ